MTDLGELRGASVLLVDDAPEISICSGGFWNPKAVRYFLPPPAKWP